MTTKLKCLLLDDELAALSYTRLLCEQMPGVEVVKAFNDPLKFMEAAGTLDFNTCVLDIQMPGLNGLDVAAQLKSKIIIFTTAHKEFAAEAFDLNAVDYIRKPLEKERFELAMHKAMARFENGRLPESTQHIWNTDKGKTPLAFDDMLYIAASETDSRDKTVLMKNGSRLTIKNMRFEKLLGTLPAAKFCRINKKEIIALHAVTHFDASHISTGIVLKNTPAVFYLSSVYRSLFLQKMKVLQA